MRKICAVVHSRANYGRIKTLLQAVKEHPELELQLVVGASALLGRYGSVHKIIEEDGFKINAKVYIIIEGETPTTMAKSTGLAIVELSTIFENLKPDIVITVADRFETMSTAVAASYMNIMVAHTQGGEVTGSIDEGVRHAITKLSHVHFPATKLSARNIINMGENANDVHLVGCPAIDIVKKTNSRLSKDIFNEKNGVGAIIDKSKPFLLVLQHPVTTEYGQGITQIQKTLEAIKNINMQTVWLWPNIDAGSDDISKGIRIFREQNLAVPIRFYKNFSPEDYTKLLANTACIVGNSSSAIREGSYLGTPAVNIGTRQSSRECGENVIHADYNSKQIFSAIKSQLKHGKYKPSKLFGNGNAGKKIASLLAKCEIKIQKTLKYNNVIDLERKKNAK